MLKIIQVGLQQYMNQELRDVQARFRKSRGTRYQIANIYWLIEKAREFQKNIYLCFIDCAKTFDCVDHKNYGKFFKRWEYQTTLTCLLRNLYAHQEETVKTIHEQLTSSESGKEYFKAIYCHPAYLTYMQSTSCEMLD